MHTLNGIDSKFRLAILVARRAKQLIGGAHRKVEIKSDNTLTVAMEEFRQGKINFDTLDQEDNFFQQPGVGEAGTEATPIVEDDTDLDSDLGAEEAAGEKAEADSDS